MSIEFEIPEGWMPPHKVVGNEDNVELFAIRLLEQIVTMLCVRARDFDLPIAADTDKYVSRKEAIVKNLKDQNVYYSGTEGSVFIDYKIMRQIAAQQVGWGSIESQFTTDMSTDEAIQLARSIVANWNWAQNE
ncbi:MAG: hypothetical protein ABI425_04180 [Patescibacteria group bacterium]